MLKLNQKELRELRILLGEADYHVPLFAVERGKVVILSNVAWLLEWPIEMVDIACSQYGKLLAMKSEANKKNPTVVDKINRSWRDSMFGGNGEFHEAVEVERIEGEHNHCAAFDLGHRRAQYDICGISAFEMVDPTLHFEIYENGSSYPLLVPRSGDVIIGAQAMCL